VDGLFRRGRTEPPIGVSDDAMALDVEWRYAWRAGRKALLRSDSGAALITVARAATLD